MGYYDDFEPSKRPKQRGSVGTWVAAVVISALIGSGTTIALVPTLIKSNVIPTSGSSSFSLSGNNSNSSATTSSKQNVSVNVQSGVVDAVNKVKPAVVGVVNLQKARDFFGRSSQTAQPTGTGSGVLFDSKGYIVTNNHVVEGADKVQISMQDGKYYDATVVGTDPTTDLAVIKVDPKVVASITPAQFGNSDTLNVGEPAIAIGNPLGEQFAQTVTVGVISAVNREMPVTDEQTGQTLGTESVLQTDASINPGNSGGALVNIQGQVIGINSAKIASSGVEGIGFAIPVNEAKPIIDQLLANGKVIRPVIGIQGSDLSQVVPAYRPDTGQDQGFLVLDVNDTAAKEGLQKFDVIVKIDDTKITSEADLRKVLNSKKPGDKVTLTVYRGKQQKTVEVTLQPNNAN